MSAEARAPYSRDGRCVHCSQQNVKNGDPCKYSKQGHGTMDLPGRYTCGDCRHIERCQAIFGHIPADQSCDWFPIRFQPKPGAVYVG